jgi:acyl carrier protein
MPSVETSIEDRVLRVLRETFPTRASAITLATLIKQDLGSDSMQLITLMIALDAEFDVEFAAERIPSEDVDVAWICAFVQDTIAAAAPRG